MCSISNCACAILRLVALCRSAASEQLASDHFDWTASKLLDFENIRKKIKHGVGEGDFSIYVGVLLSLDRITFYLFDIATSGPTFHWGKGVEKV